MAKLTTDWSIEVSHLADNDFAVRLYHSSEHCCRMRLLVAVAVIPDDVISVSDMMFAWTCWCGEPLPKRQLIESVVRTYAERLAERIERDRGMP